ncbi:MAG: hypothetical protein ACLQHF_06770 [Terracidiphilus sp.]
MRFRRWISIPGLAVVFAFFPSPFTARAGASTPFAITATNVTMPASGNGSSSYTVAGIPLTGTLGITCQYSGPTTEAKIPTCTYGPLTAIPVNEGQTVTGTVYFYPYGSAVPLDRQQTGRSGSPMAVLSLAGALLFGFGFRRRFRRNSLALLLAICTLVILPAISACGGNGNGMTPGT